MGGIVISGGRVVDPRAGRTPLQTWRYWMARLPRSDGARRRRTSHRRHRPGGGPRFHRPHAHGESIQRTVCTFDGVTTTLDLEAGVLPVNILVPASSGPGTGIELRRLHQLGLRAHRCHDRLQSEKSSPAGVRPCHARILLIGAGHGADQHEGPVGGGARCAIPVPGPLDANTRIRFSFQVQRRCHSIDFLHTVGWGVHWPCACRSMKPGTARQAGGIDGSFARRRAPSRSRQSCHPLPPRLQQHPRRSRNSAARPPLITMPTPSRHSRML